MADDKKKAERRFIWQALKEAAERMKPELLVRLLTSSARTTLRVTSSSLCGP